MQVLHTLLLAGSITLVMAWVQPPSPGTSDDNDTIRWIVQLLKAMPPWPCLPLSDTAPDYEEKRRDVALAAKKIESITAEISRHDSYAIRAAFVEFSKSGERRDALEIVNRYLFKVSERPTRLDEERMVRYRWAMPILEGRASPGADFPWKPDESGRLRFSIESRGFIGFGQPYDGVKTFDYYRDHFGRRQPSVEKDE